jgi:hypothetical protein
MASLNLHEQLAKLHAELAVADHVDPALRDLAADVMQDIARLVAVPDTTPPATRSAVDRLDALTVQFEVAHPAVAASLRRLIDLLAEVGL